MQIHFLHMADLPQYPQQHAPYREKCHPDGKYNLPPHSTAFYCFPFPNQTDHPRSEAGKRKISIPKTVPVSGRLKSVFRNPGHPVQKIIPEICLKQDDISSANLIRPAGFNHHLISAVAEERPHTHPGYSKSCLPSFGKQLLYHRKQLL